MDFNLPFVSQISIQSIQKGSIETAAMKTSECGKAARNQPFRVDSSLH